MSSIHFIGGEKGGVGKSLTARLLAQYLIDRGQVFAGFDSDRSHGTFSRFYAAFTSPLNVEQYESLDEILDVAEERPDTHILVDLAAQTASHLNQWLEESDVFAIFSELERTAYWWHVMDDGADSAYLLSQLLEQKPEGVQLVVVENLGRGEDFSNFEQSTIYHQAQQQGVEFVTLKKLQPGLVQKVDFSNLSFWAAANNRELMSLVERKRVKVWLESSYEQFDRFFLPQPPLPPAAEELQAPVDEAPAMDGLQLAENNQSYVS